MRNSEVWSLFVCSVRLFSVFFFLLDLLIYLLIHFFYHFQQNTETVWCDSSKPVSATIVVLLHLAGFLKTLSPNGPVSSNCVSRPKIISKVAMMKTTSAAMLFALLLLSFSSLFLFLLSFSFVTVILELLGLKNPAFWPQISLGWFFKKSVKFD